MIISGIVQRLRSGTHNSEKTTLAGVEHDLRCLEAAERIEELEKALHAVNRHNDNPARYSLDLQRILDNVIDTSDIKFDQ